MKKHLATLQEQEPDTTKNRIYNAAEEIFADKGFHGATVREIFKVADVNTGLMSYYFASKEELYAQCIQRKVQLLNDLYAASLGEFLQNTNGTPSPTEVCACYIRFFIQLGTDDHYQLQNYVRLLAQTANVYGSFNFTEVMKAFDPIIESTVDALATSLPYIARDTLKRRFHYLELSITSLLSAAEVRDLRFGKLDTDDRRNALIKEMAEFYVKGIASL